MIANKNFQPVQAITVKAVANVPAFRFVSHLGSLCAEGERALGVSDVDWLSGEHISVVTLGTILVESTTTINAGVDVASGDSGLAKTAESGEIVNGRAIEGTSGAGHVKIKLVP